MPTVRNGSAAVLAAAEALPFGVAITDPHGIVTWANAAYAQLTGSTPDELPGQSGGEFPWDALARAGPSSQPWSGEAVCRRKTGESYTAEHTITTLRDPAGEATGFWITTEDIAGLKRHRDAPSQAEANLSALIESTEDLIWSVDLNFGLLTFNRAFRDNIESTFGVRTAVGMRLEDWLPPERAAIWRPMFDRALAEGPFRTERSLLNGQILELSFNPIRQDGRAVGVSVFGKDITELKKAEKTLREAEAKYRAIFEGALEGMYRTSMEKTFLSANPAMAAILGYDSPRELVSAITDTTRQLWHDPADRKRLAALLEEHGSVRNVECRFKRKEGTGIWVSINARKVCGVDGQPPYYEGFIEDITERKRIQDALRKSEERFAIAFRSNPAITVLFRPDGDGNRYLDVNEEFERASGYRREEVIGRTSLELGLWTDPAELDALMKEFRAGGRVRNLQAHFRGKNGGGRIGLLSADWIELDGRQCAIAAIIDITERREAEARLQAQSERLQRIIENTDAGYFRIGTDGCYQDVNAAWLRMHGFANREEAIGLHYSAVQVPEDAAKAADVVETLLRGGSATSCEFSRLRRDGTIGYHSFSANPVLDGGRLAGIEGFLVDISDQKKAEQERQHTEQRYRSLFDSMQEGVAIHKLVRTNGTPENYVLLEVNRRYEQILGVRREDVVNRAATGVYGVQGAPYLKEYASVVETGTPLQFETYFPPMDKHFVISVAPMGDDRFATIFFDATDQKRTEEQYRLISENAADVIWLWDLAEGRCVYVSPSVRQLRGFSPEEVMEQPMDQSMPPHAYRMAAAETQCRIAAVESGDEAARIRTNEVEYLCKDGTAIATETVTKLLSDKEGKVRHVLGISRDIAERKRAEEAIQQANRAVVQAEAHYRLMFNSVSDAIFVHRLGEDGLPARFIEVNDNACRYLGYTRDELLRMRVSDITPPEERPNIRQRTARLAAEGELIWEAAHVAKDGRRIPVESHAHIFDLDGSQTIVSSVRDISERKEAEKKYRDIFEGALEGIYRTSREGKMLAVNPALAKMLGFESAEEVESTIDDAAHQLWLDPDGRARCAALLEEHGSVRGFECQLKRKDGTGIWLSINGRKVCGADGETLYYDGFIEDITERKRAEAALQRASEAIAKAERHYRRIFNGVSDSVFVSTLREDWPAGRFIDINDRACGYLGYSRDELLQMGPYDITAPEARVAIVAVRENLLATGRGLFETINIAKNGKRIPVEINVHVFDIDGAPMLLSSVRDISERKDAEAARAKLEEQLRQAQKLESVGRLAGGVAHDFNNLLTVINGYSGFLLKRLAAGDPLRAYADEIGIAGERAAGLTRQLLAFSRKQVIEPRVIDLNAAIRESAPMLQRLIGEDIALETRLEGGLGQVMADPDQIHRVIMNLAVNARDAMAGGGTLDIETKNVEIGQAGSASMQPAATPGRYVLMTVTDNGHGMDETVRRQVFEPFFTTKEVGKGTGLGLSTVYGIVRQSGGWIDVSSEVGVGTSFEVYLPRVDACGVPERSGIGVPIEGGVETILVVEDQQTVRAFVVAALRQCGYDVLEASDGNEAIAVAGRQPGQIHLLLTDVVMPGMNGKELSGRLKELRPDLKVLFISGYTADAIAHRGVLDRGVAFLQKPFSPEELARKVRDALAAPGVG